MGTMQSYEKILRRTISQNPRLFSWCHLCKDAYKLISEYGLDYFCFRLKKHFMNSNIRTDYEDLVQMEPDTFSVDPLNFEFAEKPMIAVVIHVYYIDLFDEICSFLKNIPIKHTLLISICKEEDKAIIAEQIEKLPLVEDAVIKVVENRGRDMAPMIVDFGPFIKSFDYICHIHSKKSTHMGSDLGWRQYLYEMLLGSEERVKAILAAFQTNKSVGMIYPESYEGVNYLGHTWLWNRDIASILLAKLGLRFDPEEYLDFPAGSMFWARKDALEPLLELDLNRQDFPEEAGQLDGALQHALERCLAIAGSKNGLSYLVIQDRTKNNFSRRGKKNLHQYFSAPFKHLLQEDLPLVNVISISIFDTLLISPFASRDMFLRYLDDLIFRKLKIKNFYYMRKKAEDTAKSADDFQRNPSIAVIYQVLANFAGLGPHEIKAMQEIELEALSDLSMPRLSIVNAAIELKKNGKRLILVEDTPLERCLVERILSKKDIDFYDSIYLSSEIYRCKENVGMWNFILEQEKVPAKKMLLHIGNDVLSDIVVPSEYKLIHTIHVMNPIILFQQSNVGSALWNSFRNLDDWRASLLYGMVANFFLKEITPIEFFQNKDPLNDPLSLGYCIYGPVVFNFLCWLIRNASRDGIDQFIFCGTDSIFLNHAYKEMANNFKKKGWKLNLPKAVCSMNGQLDLPSDLKGKKGTHSILKENFHGTMRDFLVNYVKIRNFSSIEKTIKHNNLEQIISLPDDYQKILPNVLELVDILIVQDENETSKLLQLLSEIMVHASYKAGLVTIESSGNLETSFSTIFQIPLIEYSFASFDLNINEGSRNSIKHCYWDASLNSDKGLSSSVNSLSLIRSTMHFLKGCMQYSMCDPNFIGPKLTCIDSSKESYSHRTVCSGILLFISDMQSLFGTDVVEIEFPIILLDYFYKLAPKIINPT